MNKRKIYAWVVLSCLLAALLFPAAALAGHYEIDTDDGSVDADWVSVNATVIDGDDFGTQNYDIQQAWVTNSGNDFYFRIQLVPGARLPNNGAVAARLDCNKDSSYITDEVDTIAWYRRDTDEARECEGSAGTNHCHNQPGTTRELNDNTFGEEIATDLGGGVMQYDYEWRADTNEGAVNWSACAGNVDIVFATAYLLGTEQDNTETGGSVVHYNVPTSVTLERFSAHAGRRWLGTIGAGLLALIAVSITVPVALRRRNHPAQR